MKICFIINDLNNRAGTERATVLVANECAKNGYDVSILSFIDVKKPGFFVEEKIEIINLGLNVKNFKVGYLKVIKRLKEIQNEYNFDVIIESEVYNRLFTFIPFRKRNFKLITWEHLNYFATFGRSERKLARKLAARNSDFVVALTKQDKENYLKHEKCLAKIVTIPNSLSFYPDKLSTLNNKKVLAVGRLSPEKGFDKLIEAWDLIINKEKNRDWSLTIIGSGQEKENLLKLIDKYRLKNNVNLIENTLEIEKYYEEASIFVMTSKFEGFGMVLTEAMSFGVPVVSFDCETGPRELITNEINGYLCEQGNVVELANNVNLLIRNPNLRGVLGKNAYELSKQYSIENVFKMWKNIIF